MRKFLLGSVGLVAILAVPAMAADMPIKRRPLLRSRTTIGPGHTSASTLVRPGTMSTAHSRMPSVLAV